MLNMKTKAIRGMSEEDWNEIKMMANQKGMPIGKLIKSLADNAKREDLKKRWESILSFRFKDADAAREVEETVRDIRKNFKVRDFK